MKILDYVTVENLMPKKFCEDFIQLTHKQEWEKHHWTYTDERFNELSLKTKELDIPVYGIGAGDKVNGQLVIMHDLIGLFWEFKSKFVKRYCEAGQLIQSALTDYANEVRELQFPSSENFYEIKDDELEKLLGQGGQWKQVKNGDDEKG